MKKYFSSLFAILSFSFCAKAQDVQKDISVTGNYRINSILPLGKFRIWPILTNNSSFDYKDITLRMQFIAGDGTVEGFKDYVMHDYIGPGITKKLGEQYLECPKDCKSITLAVVDGKKLK